MIDLLLDPDKALDAVNKAVALVKKASKTVDNIESLGPVLGKYFDAKAQAVAAAQNAKGISMGKALEIEMAIDANKSFENELQKLFIAAGKIDVWNKAQARFQESQVAAAKDAAKAKAEAKRKKKEQEEMIEIVVACSIGAVFLGLALWGGWELLMWCKQNGCGR
jgi:hypothetical protein